MRPRTILIMMLALVFGLAAALGVNVAVSRGGGPPVETVKVVVATTNMTRGSLVTADSVRLRDYPKDLIPEGGLTKAEDAIDRVVAAPVLKDEPLLEGKLSPKGAGRGMAALIPAGKRAFTIQTPNVASGVAGFIMPGNRVDVLLSVTENVQDDPSGGGSSTTLLQNVEILAVDQRIDAPTDNKVDPKELSSVTLLVTPDEAALLDLGQNKGKLHLSLRNLKDDTKATHKPATITDLRNIHGLSLTTKAKKPTDKAVSRAPAGAPPTALMGPPPMRIRTLRGTVEDVVKIESPPRDG